MRGGGGLGRGASRIASLMAVHRLSDIDGALLDKAVAIALGWRECANPQRSEDGLPCWQFGPNPNFHIIRKRQWRPHADWGQAGPIIEREGIAISRVESGRWSATCPRAGGGLSVAYGARPLIAALRAFAASRLGEMVDLP